MPLCGFTPEMLQGLTQFARGLYQQASKRAKTESISIEDAFDKEVHEMNVFLAALDEKYYEDLSKRMSVDEAMRELVGWTEDKLAKTS